MADPILDAEAVLCQMQADLRWLECRLAALHHDQHGAAVARRITRDAVRVKQKLVGELEREQELAAA